jgi:hypothetical protein
MTLDLHKAEMVFVSSNALDGGSNSKRRSGMAPVGWYGFYLRAFGAMASQPVEHVCLPLCDQLFVSLQPFLSCSRAQTRLP